MMRKMKTSKRQAVVMIMAAYVMFAGHAAAGGGAAGSAWQQGLQSGELRYDSADCVSPVFNTDGTVSFNGLLLQPGAYHFTSDDKIVWYEQQTIPFCENIDPQSTPKCFWRFDGNMLSGSNNADLYYLLPGNSIFYMNQDAGRVAGSYYNAEGVELAPTLNDSQCFVRQPGEIEDQEVYACGGYWQMTSCLLRPSPDWAVLLPAEKFYRSNQWHQDQNGMGVIYSPQSANLCAGAVAAEFMKTKTACIQMDFGETHGSLTRTALLPNFDPVSFPFSAQQGDIMEAGDSNADTNIGVVLRDGRRYHYCDWYFCFDGSVSYSTNFIIKNGGQPLYDIVKGLSFTMSKCP